MYTYYLFKKALYKNEMMKIKGSTYPLKSKAEIEIKDFVSSRQ
jgi:hypothetical protein